MIPRILPNDTHQTIEDGRFVEDLPMKTMVVFHSYVGLLEDRRSISPIITLWL
jgi:hypothetical protein